MSEPHTLVIPAFAGEYRFLSNFWPAVIKYGGVEYPTSEHLYQSMKCLSEQEAEQIRLAPTPGKAKNLGQKCAMIPDWNDLRVPTMTLVQILKYKQNSDLLVKLKKTAPHRLEEGNTWGDKFWGVCMKTNEGENHLGKILMMIRRCL